MPTVGQFDPDTFMLQRQSGTIAFDPDDFMAKKQPVPAQPSPEHSLEDSMWNFGWPNVVNGIGQALKSGQRMVGLHKAFTGATQVAAPFALPALATAPLATLGTIAAGTAGGALGKIGSEFMGASPEASDLVSDAGGLIGGGLATSPKVQAFTNGAVKAIPGAVADNGSPSLLNILKGKTSLPATIGAVMGHFVGHPYEGAAAGTAIGALPSMVQGGTTAAENASWLPDIFKSPVVRPPAARFGTSPTVLPDLTPIPGKLPGPRSVPSVEARIAAASTPEPITSVRPQIPTQATLDAAAKRIGFKSYAETPPGNARTMVENTAKIWTDTTGPEPAPKAKPRIQPVAAATGAVAPAPVATSMMPDIESRVIAPQAAGSAPIQPVENNINYPANVHEQLHAAGPEVAITHATNASAKDLAVAARLKNLNITPEALDAMPDADLNKHYTDLGYKKLGSDYAPGKRVGRDAATGRAHLRNVLGGLWSQ